jgi:hypothetical protein
VIAVKVDTPDDPRALPDAAVDVVSDPEAAPATDVVAV